MLKSKEMLRQAVRMYRALEKARRRLHEERIKAGKLLIRLRKQIGIENRHGGFRGSHAGTFCTQLKVAGLNIGTCYADIALAEGKSSKTAYRKRIDYFTKFVHEVKKATPQHKVALLGELAAFLIGEYDIPAKFTLEAKSFKKAA